MAKVLRNDHGIIMYHHNSTSTAYVFMNCSSGAEERIIQEIADLPEVKEVRGIYGIYDIFRKGRIQN